MLDLVVIGGGPAGLSAATYAASEGLNTVILEGKRWGGQIVRSMAIENLIGYPNGITGQELIRDTIRQVDKFRATKIQESAVGLARDGRHIRIVTTSQELTAKSVLLATGISPTRLQFNSPTYYDCSVIPDGNVAVIGGANSAGQAALYLANWRQVTIVARRELQTTMSAYLRHRIEWNRNIRVHIGKASDISAEAYYIFAGGKPRTQWLPDTIERDNDGYVIAPNLATTLPGVFAAGDGRQGATKRLGTAIGEGGQAVTAIHSYLKA